MLENRIPSTPNAAQVKTGLASTYFSKKVLLTYKEKYNYENSNSNQTLPSQISHDKTVAYIFCSFCAISSHSCNHFTMFSTIITYETYTVWVRQARHTIRILPCISYYANTQYLGMHWCPTQGSAAKIMTVHLRWWRLSTSVKESDKRIEINIFQQASCSPGAMI